MFDPRAIAGEFADLKSVKTRSVVQIVIECPIEEGERIVRMFGFPQPGKPVRLAVARLAEGSVAQLDERRASNAEDAGSSPVGAAKPKREWSALSPAQQAGIRCNEKSFWAFLRERGLMASCAHEDDAATYVRVACLVKSRADIGKTRDSLLRWKELEAEFQAWLSDPTGSDPLASHEAA